MFDMYEAASLLPVTVKLLVDTDQFLALQRKFPAEYVSKRIAISVPITHFDDDWDESKIFHRIINKRRKEQQEPLICQVIKNDKHKRKKLIQGRVLDYDPVTRRYLVEVAVEDLAEEKPRKYFTKRVCLHFTDFESKGDMDARRLHDMTSQKQAFLRLNIERMFYSEALKQRPDLRPNPQSVNRIEKLVNLPRIERFKGEALDPAKVREVAKFAEAIHATAQVKSVCMSELEEENPRFA